MPPSLRGTSLQLPTSLCVCTCPGLGVSTHSFPLTHPAGARNLDSFLCSWNIPCASWVSEFSKAGPWACLNKSLPLPTSPIPTALVQVPHQISSSLSGLQDLPGEIWPWSAVLARPHTRPGSLGPGRAGQSNLREGFLFSKTPLRPLDPPASPDQASSPPPPGEFLPGVPPPGAGFEECCFWRPHSSGSRVQSVDLGPSLSTLGLYSSTLHRLHA